MSSSNWIHLDVEKIVKITDSAMLVLIDSEEFWLPLSQVDDSESFQEDDENITVSVTEWIAKQKGLGE